MRTLNNLSNQGKYFASNFLVKLEYTASEVKTNEGVVPSTEKKQTSRKIIYVAQKISKLFDCSQSCCYQTDAGRAVTTRAVAIGPAEFRANKIRVAAANVCYGLHSGKLALLRLSSGSSASIGMTC